MRNYRITNNYKRINRVTIEDLKSNLYYLIWADGSAICFGCNPARFQGSGYMKLFGKACVFEEDDIIPYIYE